MKKIYTRILFAAIILLPTCFAILSFLYARTEPIQTASITAMELTGPDGTTVHLDAQIREDAKLIRFFIELNDNARSIEALPSDLEESPCYRAVYIGRSAQKEYFYYFSSTKPSSSYFLDHNGNAFQIDASDTIAFLDSDYSGGLYTYSCPPQLTAVGETVEPNSVAWSYFTYSNVEHTVVRDKDERQTLTTSYASFTLQFDMFPDESSLKITDDDNNIIYTGSYADFIKENRLKELVRKDMCLHFDLTAQWAYNASLGYGGSVSYQFDVQVIFDPAATFWLGETVVELGDFVVLSGKYVEDIQELSFSSEPSIQYEPLFFTDGEYVRALIPISQNLPDGAGEYKLQVTYLGIVHTLSLKVNETTYASTVKRYNYGGKVYTSARTEESLEAFRSFISSLPYQETPLFNGSFVMNSGENLRASFGNTIDNDTSANRFLSNGTAYVAYEGTKIYAVNQGQVIAVENTVYGGNTVVVDHGIGLRSVYYCVGKVSVSVGDMVSTGSLIGTGADSKGYTDGITGYCELWVGSIPVSYYPLTASGRTGMIVYGDVTE